MMSENLGLSSHKSSCNCTGCGMLRAGVCINCAERAAALILESGPGEIAVEPCSGACREAIELYFSTPQAADNLRHDGSLTATARLVGLEIFSFVSKVSGTAWPAEETIADRLGITARTVRTAIKQLKAAGYISVVRRGRSNMYFPMFIDLIEENFSGIEGGSSDTSPEKNGADTGKKQHAIPEKNDPLTLLSNPIRTPSSKAAAEERKIAQRNKRKDRQKAENEIADILGWECLAEVPADEVEDLCRCWPNVDQAKLFELKQQYGPPAAVGGCRARP
jgi:biotin operon repressor